MIGVVATMPGDGGDGSVDQRTGAIVRELDIQPNTRFTWSSPTTGRSFSYPYATAYHYRYAAGTEPGAPVVVRQSGLEYRTPRLRAVAGRTDYGNAFMLFVTDDGVPIVDFGEPTSRTSRDLDGALNDAAICAALAP